MRPEQERRPTARPEATAARSVWHTGGARMRPQQERRPTAWPEATAARRAWAQEVPK